MIFYVENSKDSTKKMLEMMNELTQVTGYKLNIQKSFAFLYTNNEVAKREIKESIPLTITPKIRYL